MAFPQGPRRRNRGAARPASLRSPALARRPPLAGLRSPAFARRPPLAGLRPSVLARPRPATASLRWILKDRAPGPPSVARRSERSSGRASGVPSQAACGPRSAPVLRAPPPKRAPSWNPRSTSHRATSLAGTGDLMGPEPSAYRRPGEATPHPDDGENSGSSAARRVRGLEGGGQPSRAAHSTQRCHPTTRDRRARAAGPLAGTFPSDTSAPTLTPRPHPRRPPSVSRTASPGAARGAGGRAAPRQPRAGGGGRRPAPRRGSAGRRACSHLRGW